MAARIFEEKVRTDSRPAKYAEQSFRFYDRCSWPLTENVRQLLNSWLSDFPEEGQENLARRFKTEFESAFFELLCYTIFKRLGFELEEHPAMSHTSKRCDFIVNRPGQFFYLECISTNGFSQEQEAQKNTENLFYDLLDEMNCPNFYLRLETVRFKGKRTPAFSKVRRDLQRLVDEINPDDVNVEQIRDFSMLPVFQHQDADFQLSLQVIPKPLHRRASQSRNIVAFETRTKFGGFGEVLLDAIKRKAIRYGKVGHPFLLAINALTELPIDEYDIEDALYDHYTTYLPGMLSGQMQLPQQAESAFLTHGRIIQTRISAVLFTKASPTNLLHIPYWIYYHPRAEHPLHLNDLPLNGHHILDDGVNVIQGKSIGELLGLPADWPGERNK